MMSGKMKWLCAVYLGITALFISIAPQKAEAQEPFLGELRAFGFNFCPRGWSPADGELLPISANSALFSLYGTTYGGDGRTTFGLPELRGRSPIHTGTGPGLQEYRMGARGGAEEHTISEAEMPSHNHLINTTNETANKHGPGTDFLAAPYLPDGSKFNIYHEGPATRQMDPGVVSNTGGSRAMPIRAPYLTLNWCVAVTGIYPSRS